jgi:hypothetical protein
LPKSDHSRDSFGFFAFYAPQRSIKDFLVLPSLLAWRRELRLALDPIGERINLQRVGSVV